MRKKAGLPDLDADVLPSTIMQRVMILIFELSKPVFGSRFWRVDFVKGISFRLQLLTSSRRLRTAMTKRQAKLQIGMDKLTAAAKLSSLQTQLLEYTWVVTSDFVIS